MAEPQFIATFTDLSVPLGEEARFSCQCVALPSPEISWFKNFRELFDGKKYSVESDGATFTLRIRNVDFSDAGDVECQAKNRYGTVSIRAKLAVLAPANVDLPPHYGKGLRFCRGDTIKVRVPITGTPPPDVEWFKKNKPVTEIKALAPRLEITGTHLHTTLIIDDCIKSDEAIYTLEVTNELGSATVDIPIWVVEPPNPPTDVIITNIDKHAITLSWQPPEYDGGSPITGYIVERLDPSTSVWRYSQSVPRPVCTVSCLDEHTEHKFRIMAENMFGVSEPSMASMAATTKEPLPFINYEDFVDSGFLGTPVDVTRIQGDVLGRYIICEELGRGAFGVVHRAIERATMKNWAAKFVHCRHGDKDLVRREIELMNSLHHPKLLQLHEAFDQTGEMVMILELLSGGELFDRLVAEDYDLKESDCIEYMRQICQGVQHMHNNNIIHLDLKPENVMCVNKDSNDVKIIDFGLAQRMEEGKQIKVLFGTAEFCAPEIINFEPVSFSTDLWSIGVLTYVLLSGYSPFAGEDQRETFSLVNNADYDFDEDVWDNVSEDGKDFIKRLLIKDKKQRMTIDEALTHPWLNGAAEKKLVGQKLSTVHHKDYRERTKHKEDDLDALPMGRLSRDSAVFRKEGDEGVVARKLIMELPEHAPVVYEPLTDVTGFEGSRVQLSCKIIGKPVPKILWLNEGQEITEDARHRLSYKEGVATLQVMDLEPQDAGSYTCEATNNIGATETTAELHVEEVRHRRKRKEEAEAIAERKVAKQEVVGAPEDNLPPEFTLPLIDQVKQAGEDVEFNVTVTCRPEPEVKWFCGTVPVIPSSRYIFEHNKGVYRLTVRNLTSQDAAEWRCVAVNAFGKASCSCDLKVIESIPDDHRPPRFPRELEDMTVTRGSKVQLECEVIGFPQPTIQWYKDRQRIQTDKHYEVRCENNLCLLFINITEYDDSGAYMCRAVNDAGSASTEARVRVQSVRDTVMKPDRPLDHARVSETPTRRYKFQVPPDFTAKLKNKRVPTGMTVHLNCSVTGIPEPQIRWLKDGLEVFEGTEFSMRNNYGLLSLEIINVQSKHAGTYTCECSNEEGTTSCSATLQVEVEEELEAVELEFLRPRFLTPLEDIWANEGEDVTFSCKAAGKPMPSFKWQKDMLELSQSNRIQITTDSKGGATLTIHKVKTSDAGLYLVQAQSQSGRSKSSATLRVRGKSGSPPSSPDVVQRPSFDGGYATLQQIVVPGRPPNFSIMLPAKLEVHEGERLKLDCSVRGFPTPMVTWSKSYRGLMYGARHRIMFVGTLHTMEIPQTMSLDSGEYIVRATNVFGCVETSCTVTVLPPRKKGESHPADLMHLEASQKIKQGDESTPKGKAPFFIKHLPHTIEVMEGTNVRLDCILRGGVELVQWSQEGADQSKRDLEREGFEGDFVPMKDRPSGSGAASGSSGRAADGDGDPTSFKTTLHDLSLGPDSEAVFQCVTSSFAEGTWYKNGKPLSASTNVQITSDGTLHRLVIKAVTTDDEADYTFEVTSSAGSVSSSAILKLDESPKKEKSKSSGSKFSKDLPAETLATVGDSVTLTCAVSNPITEVFWGKDNRRLSFSSKRFSTTQQRDGTVALQLNKLVTTDAGSYRCTAIMADGTQVQTTTQLALSDPETSKPQASQDCDTAPVFIKPLQNQKIHDGDTIILKCSIEGHPRPQITWYRNGSEILDNQDILISTIGSDCKLQILDVYPEDEGQYSCTAKNCAGEATTKCYITVEDAYMSGDSESSASYGARADRNNKHAAARR